MERVYVTTDKSLLDVEVIHGFLTESYWSKGITKEKIIKCIRNSITFGVFEGKKQIGFARVTTDYTLFAYIADVFILEEFRGKGYSKLLMKSIMEHPDLGDIRAWLLATRDAHGLYEQFGFKKVDQPDRYMIKREIK